MRPHDLLHRWVLSLSVLLLLVSAALAQTASGAMVLELRGQLAHGSTSIGILQSLAAGQTFELSEGAEAKLGEIGTSRQWKLQGPLTFKITESGPLKTSNSGTISEVERPRALVSAPAKGVNLQKMGGVRRSLLWITSDPGQLTPTPTIAWETAGTFDKYSLEIQDDQGKSVFTTDVEGGAKSFTVPVTAAFQPGSTYFVQLQGQQGRRGYTCNSRLRLVPDEQSVALREALQAYREEFEQTGDVSCLSLSILELASFELYNQVSPLLEEIAQLRPDDPSIAALRERLAEASKL